MPDYIPDPALVELVARALAAEDVHWGYDHGFASRDDEETEAFARAVLAALAAEGRLLPPDAVTGTEWGISGNLAGEVVETSTADALDLCPTYGTPVTRTVWVGPWLPAPEETP